MARTSLKWSVLDTFSSPAGIWGFEASQGSVFSDADSSFQLVLSSFGLISALLDSANTRGEWGDS